jgi:hypothetical protein
MLDANDKDNLVAASSVDIGAAQFDTIFVDAFDR